MGTNLLIPFQRWPPVLQIHDDDGDDDDDDDGGDDDDGHDDDRTRFLGSHFANFAIIIPMRSMMSMMMTVRAHYLRKMMMILKFGG